MPDEIPQEQMERIRPVVQQMRDHLRLLTTELPGDAPSALVFSPAEEAPE